VYHGHSGYTTVVWYRETCESMVVEAKRTEFRHSCNDGPKESRKGRKANTRNGERPFWTDAVLDIQWSTFVNTYIGLSSAITSRSGWPRRQRSADTEAVVNASRTVSCCVLSV